MLDLTPQLRELLLEQLNERQQLAAWNALLAGEEYDYHRARERERYDTDLSPFHHALGTFVSERLTEMRASLPHGAQRPAGAELLGRWLDCADVFALSRTEAGDADWVVGHVGRRPLSAFRVGCTVFYLSGRGRANWQAREWTGPEEPLLRLPYQRKYDFERHGRADERLRFAYEALQVSLDLLLALRERLTDLDVCDGAFSWPELSDIQTELAQLGLGLGSDAVLPFGGSFGLQLVALRPEPDDDGKQRAGVDFTVEKGCYRGVLGGYHRRPSGALRCPLSAASQKWVLSRALQELTDRVQAIVASSGSLSAIETRKWPAQ